MIQKITFALFILFSITARAQINSSTIQGKITDKATLEELPFAKVLLYKNDTTLISYSSTSFDGQYILKNISPGNYSLSVKYIGYTSHRINKIVISNDTITEINITLSPSQELNCVEVIYCSQKRSNISKIASKVSVRGSRKSNHYYEVEENNESYSKTNDNDFKKVNKTPLSTISIDVDNASYSNIRRHINEGGLPPSDAVRIEEMINYFSYDYPEPANENPFSITLEYTDCPWNEDNKIAKIGLKGQEINMKNAPANNLVFLIDVSGSMNSSDKLDLLKTGFYMLIDQLRDKDKISIVVYAGAAGVALPITEGKYKNVIKDAIEKLSSDGSTAGGQGINLAYKIAKDNYIKNGNNRVILATDGDFNVGASSEVDLLNLIESKRQDNIFLSVLGFGRGNLKDSKMELLANKGNGNYNYIDNALEAKKVLVTELGGTLLTIAKDVKIQAEFNPRHVKAYRLIGYVNRQLNDEDFNNDKKDAGELGSGHTVTVLYEIVPKHSKIVKDDVDSLKYQHDHSIKNSEKFKNEILTVKFRYKKPKGKKSILFSKVLFDESTTFSNSSIDSQFSITVAGFGMLLRNSKYKGNLTFKQVIKYARASKGEDKEGYRAEFIRLVEMAELLIK